MGGMRNIMKKKDNSAESKRVTFEVSPDDYFMFKTKLPHSIDIRDFFREVVRQFKENGAVNIKVENGGMKVGNSE